MLHGVCLTNGKIRYIKIRTYAYVGYVRSSCVVGNRCNKSPIFVRARYSDNNTKSTFLINCDYLLRRNATAVVSPEGSCTGIGIAGIPQNERQCLYPCMFLFFDKHINN